MYDVVGCPNCRMLWIRSGDAATTTCPQCERRHHVDGLRVLASKETPEEARDARTQLLAARSVNIDESTVSGFSELSEAVEDAGMSEQEYLEATGLELDDTNGGSNRRRNRREIVLWAIEDLEAPTESNIRESAASHGVSNKETSTILSRLLAAGELVRDGDHYRVI